MSSQQATMRAPLTIKPVDNRQDIRDFLRLPEKIYRDDPHWIAPLLFEQKERVFGHNPFFQHASVKAWIASRGDEAVGRITAQLDTLQPTEDGQKVGYFGMIECLDDTEAFALLFATAEGWLKAQGVGAIRGPFNLSINEEVGLLIEGFERPSFIMMGHGRPFYDARVAELGYQKAQDILTYTIEPDFGAPDVMKRLAQKAASQVTVRCLDRKNRRADFEIMRDIFNDAWANNWGFVPFTREEFNEVANLLTLLLDDDYIQIAEINRRPVAFIVALPNINEAALDLQGRLLPFGWIKLLWRLKVRRPGSARVALMGVRREYQHARLGPTLAFMVIDEVRRALSKRKVKTVEMGWILESNAGMRHIIDAIGGAVYKKYRIYQKRL